jgi:galactosamine-6-phosphate isomerase
MNPTLCLCDDYESLSRQAADRMLNALGRKQDMLLCAAGGSTPLRTYELLAEHRARAPDAFRLLRVVKLDEWGGLPTEDPATCDTQLRTRLIHPLGLSDDRYLRFESDPADPEAACEQVRARLEREGPIDVCVLGLGTNGHIAMNEPAASLKPNVHVAKLTQETLGHSMLANSRKIPSFGLTLGMSEILASREILLLVSGASKREPLQRFMRREITTLFPASFLWLHPNWTLLCDRAAVAGLVLKS